MKPQREILSGSRSTSAICLNPIRFAVDISWSNAI